MGVPWSLLKKHKNTTKIASNRDFLSRQEPRSSFQFETRNRNSTRNYFRRFLNNTSLTVHQKVAILTRRSLNFLVFWKHQIWVFPKIGVPQNGWFIMENPIKMDDLKGYHHFRKHPYSHSIFSISPLRLGIKILPPRNFDEKTDTCYCFPLIWKDGQLWTLFRFRDFFGRER